MGERRGALIPGLALVLLGGWLLARNLGLALPGLEVLWPGFPLLFGLGFLAQFFAGGRRDDGLVFVGLAGALTGAFFFLFTTGRLEWGDMARYWPAFVLIGGTAFLGQWLASPAQRGLLVSALLALLVGLAAGAFTLGLASREWEAQVVRLWPVALIVAGVVTLAGALLRKRE